MPVSREKLIRNAEKFVSRGRIEAAIREYRKVLEDQPRDTGTLNRVGDLYARINKIDEAVRLFTQIAEQYTEEGFFVKAIAIYKKIIKLDPTRLGVYEKLAGLYHRQGLVNEARTQYQVLADYYLKHSNAASAISIYQQMADLEPDDPAHRAKLAELYQQEQLNDKAMEQYQLIADVMLGHERVDQAVQVLQRGLELNPNDLDYLAVAVDKLREAGQSAGARQLLEVAKEKNPAAGALLDSMPEEDAVAGDDLAGDVAVEEGLAEDAASSDEGGFGDGFPAGGESGSDEDFGSFTLGSEEDEQAEGASALETEMVDLPSLSGQDDLLDRDDELQRAMAEAEAALGGEEDGSTPLEDGDILLEWDDATSESLIAPPPDMADAGPEVAGTGFSKDLEKTDPEETEAEKADPEETEDPHELTDSWEIDLSDLDLGSVDLVGEAPPEEPVSEEEAAEDPPAEEPEVEEPEPGSEESPSEVSGEVEVDLDSLDLDPVSADDYDFGRDLETAEDATDATAEGAEDWLSADEVAEPIEEEILDLDDTFPEIPGVSIAAKEEDSAPDPQETTFEDMLSEAEVLAKYGLKEKAYERVEQVLVVEAGHPGAHRVLIQLQLEDGNEKEVRRLAAELQRLTEEQGDSTEWQKVEALFAAAGFSLEGKAKKKAAPKRPRKADRPTGDRIDRLLASLLEDKIPSSAPPPRSKAAPTEDLLSSIIGAPTASRKKASTPPPSGPSPEDLSLQDPSSEDLSSAEAASQDQSPEAPYSDKTEETVKALGQPPQDVNLEDDSDIDDAIANMSPVFEIPDFSVAASAPVASGASADEELGEDTGTSWLDEVEAEREQADSSDELFDEEEGFFDLAAELEEELTVSDALGTEQGGEQTLEEIVEGFKRGVEEHLSEEDYDTHFDLGIAYREMGLLDEAIGEFQLASKAPEHLASCCSMLGICFLDKGLPELAIKWYTRGLESPSLSEEDSLALLYDLGTVYMTMGDQENARKTFVEVYGIRSSYRDVADQLAALDPS